MIPPTPSRTANPVSNAFQFKFALGEQEVLRELPEDFRDALLSTDKILNDTVHPFLLSHTRAVFDQKGDPTGTSWKGYEDEPRYYTFKALALEMSNPEDRLMRWKDKGDMKEYLYPSLTNPRHNLHIFRVQGMKAIFGTRLGYAKRLAQLGGVNPFGEPYPPRPLLEMSENQQDALKARIAAAYENLLRNKGYNVDFDVGPSDLEGDM